MFVRGPLVKAEQDSSIRIQDLTPVFMARSRLSLAEKRLVPLKTFWNVTYADDCPYPFHELPLATRRQVVSPPAWMFLFRDLGHYSPQFRPVFFSEH
jgi:hypothetical protein